MNSKIVLQNLYLKNFATFEDDNISFHSSFNSIIGETGSGKSLILEALQLILGSRADKKLIRAHSEFAILEACFKVEDPSAQSFFQEIDYPYEEKIVTIKRIIYQNGASKAYLNHQTCSLATLNKFSKEFIDLVGQFENQKLLSEEYQLALLDDYSKISTQVSEFTQLFANLKLKQKELVTLRDKQSNQESEKDFLLYQIDEIDKLNPSIQDELDLIERKSILINFEQKQATLSQVQDIVSESSAGNIVSLIRKLIHTISGSEVLSSSHIQIQESIDFYEELSFTISKEQEDSFDQNEFNQILDRLDLYQKLKRKYGKDILSIVAQKNIFKEKLSFLQQIEENISVLENEISDIKHNCHTLALQIHEQRTKASIAISKKLTALIQNLNMDGASIEIKISKEISLSNSGYSKLSFMAETNPGEGFFKVKQIASGGELSRILLAMRQVLASNDSISVFLFDEIDTGIGGETALKIGSILESVAQQSQVIAITHLPQIANYSNQLIIVNKKHISSKRDKKRTISNIELIKGNAKFNHIKAMTPLC